jgi:hypothetical protein
MNLLAFSYRRQNFKSKTNFQTRYYKLQRYFVLLDRFEESRIKMARKFAKYVLRRDKMQKLILRIDGYQGKMNIIFSTNAAETPNKDLRMLNFLTELNLFCKHLHSLRISMKM